MQIQRGRAFIQPAPTVVQMNPLAGLDRLGRSSDDDAVFHYFGVRRDIEHGHLVAQTNRLAAVDPLIDACADDLDIFFAGISQQGCHIIRVMYSKTLFHECQLLKDTVLCKNVGTGGSSFDFLANQLLGPRLLQRTNDNFLFDGPRNDHHSI